MATHSLGNEAITFEPLIICSFHASAQDSVASLAEWDMKTPIAIKLKNLPDFIMNEFSLEIFVSDCEVRSSPLITPWKDNSYLWRCTIINITVLLLILWLLSLKFSRKDQKYQFKSQLSQTNEYCYEELALPGNKTSDLMILN